MGTVESVGSQEYSRHRDMGGKAKTDTVAMLGANMDSPLLWCH